MFIASLIIGSIAGVLFLYAIVTWFNSLNFKNKVVDT